VATGKAGHALAKVTAWAKGKQGKKVLVAGAVLAGVYLVMRGRGGGVSPLVSLATAKVTGGEPVTAESYRVIQARRSGMTYVQATGQPGGQIGFTPEKDGIFTRNTVQEGGILYAEVK